MSCTRIRDSTNGIGIEKTNATRIAQELVSGVSSIEGNAWLMEQYRTVQGRNDCVVAAGPRCFSPSSSSPPAPSWRKPSLSPSLFPSMGRATRQWKNVYVKCIYAYRCISTFNSHIHTYSIIHVYFSLCIYIYIYASNGATGAHHLSYIHRVV